MVRLNWPNRVTIIRILLVGPLVICLLNLNSGGVIWRRVALGLFVVMALSDALDGFLARRFHEETPLGRFLDPVADKLLIASAVVLLAVESTAVPGFGLPSWVPVIALGKEVVTLTGYAVIHAATERSCIEPRIWGKLCTTVQLLLIACCLLGPDLASILQPCFAILYWVASGLAVVAIVDYIGVGSRFAAEHHANAQERENNG